MVETPGLAAFDAIPNIGILTGRAAAATSQGAEVVFVAAIWHGVLPGLVPPSVVSLGPVPRVSWKEALDDALVMALAARDKERQSIGYGWLAFARQPDGTLSRVAHMPAFVEYIDPRPPRKMPSSIPTGRCKECGDYGVIPVYGDGGENHGDRVTGRKARHWPGPWACPGCGAGR